MPVPDSVKAAGLDRAGSLAPALRNAKGTVTVSVALSEQPVGASVSEDALVAISFRPTEDFDAITWEGQVVGSGDRQHKKTKKS